MSTIFRHIGEQRVRYIWAALLVLVIVGGLAAVKGAQIASLIAFGEKAKEAGPPPEAVRLAPAKKESWEKTIEAVGSVASSRGVVVSNEAAGVVKKIHFESGDHVKRGEVLVELDTRLERAQLASQVAQRKLAQTTAKRSRGLAKEGVLSQATLDTDEAQLETSSAEVAALRAQIARKIVRAPFDGKLGIRQLNLGQYLNPGTPVADLEADSGVYVDFTVPQQRVGELSVGMPVRATFTESEHPPQTGEISAIEPNVSLTTRSVRIRASLPKAAESLRPGMFVSVAVVLPEKKEYTTIPATAVVYATFGDSVFVAKEKPADAPGMRQTPDGKPVLIARQQFVRIATRRGDFVAIEKGLQPGERVVSVGAFKLRNKAPIYESDSVEPKPELSPRPENR